MSELHKLWERLTYMYVVLINEFKLMSFVHRGNQIHLGLHMFPHNSCINVVPTDVMLSPETPSLAVNRQLERGSSALVDRFTVTPLTMLFWKDGGHK